MACAFSLCAAALAGCATAPGPRATTEGPYSEFVYEALGATPSIQFGAGRWASTPAGTNSAQTAAKKSESTPNDQRPPSTGKEANAPS